MGEFDPDEDKAAAQPWRLKLGGGGSGIDAAAVSKAEEALKSLSVNFAAWLEEEVARIEAAARRVTEQGLTPETTEDVYLRAHDLKGLGATYEFPLITRLAGSLCRLMDKPEARLGAPVDLIDAHVGAIRRAVTDQIRTDADPRGEAMARDLETRVGDHLGR